MGGGAATTAPSIKFGFCSLARSKRVVRLILSVKTHCGGEDEEHQSARGHVDLRREKVWLLQWIFGAHPRWPCTDQKCQLATDSHERMAAPPSTSIGGFLVPSPLQPPGR
jgi:hypothetical protein